MTKYLPLERFNGEQFANLFRARPPLPFFEFPPVRHYPSHKGVFEYIKDFEDPKTVDPSTISDAKLITVEELKRKKRKRQEDDEGERLAKKIKLCRYHHHAL